MIRESSGVLTAKIDIGQQIILYGWGTWGQGLSVVLENGKIRPNVVLLKGDIGLSFGLSSRGNWAKRCAEFRGIPVDFTIVEPYATEPQHNTCQAAPEDHSGAEQNRMSLPSTTTNQSLNN